MKFFTKSSKFAGVFILFFVVLAMCFWYGFNKDSAVVLETKTVDSSLVNVYGLGLEEVIEKVSQLEWLTAVDENQHFSISFPEKVVYQQGRENSCIVKLIYKKSPDVSYGILTTKNSCEDTIEDTNSFSFYAGMTYAFLSVDINSKDEIKPALQGYISANVFNSNIDEFCNLKSFEVTLEKRDLDTYRVVYNVPSQCSDFSITSNFPIAYFYPEKNKLLIITPRDSSRSQSGIFYIKKDTKIINIDKQMLDSVRFR